MNNIENMDINKYKLTFSVSAEKFQEGLDYSFNKNQKHFNIKGFRKGKVPRQIIEKTYGVEVFYDDAFNFVLQDAYALAAEESKLEIVSRPEIDVVSASKEEGVVFTAIVYTKPEVKISDYKGLVCEKPSSTVNKDDVEEYLNREREKHSRINPVTDRAVKSGDLVNIDFEGFIDGVAFEGGKGEKYDLEIGSKTFIDTFEDQIIGKNIGDEFDVNVTFPENYGKEELASKPAVFKVKINEINEKILPELNDEFIQDTTEFESLKDYKKEIKSKLTTIKKEEADKKMKEAVLEALIEKVEVNIPSAMIELEIDHKINEFRNGIAAQGLSLESYLNYMGQSLENMREAYRIICEKQVKGRLALEAVAEAEKVKVSEKDIDAELTRIAEAYHIDKEKIESIFGEKEKENIIKDLKTQKALDFLVKNSVQPEA
ncbi:trigger factor [uncultured Tyzzerella sp.]|uniref:trigger factor n=1 Tax=uncultured Tyzzerella sp. TaxID=2321398 RepID=UPI00294273D5|nr:trigger factor [uncultured Tyzzerella sp.]